MCLLSYSCDVMSKEKAIEYFEEQISKDSTTLNEFIEDSYMVGLDSVDYFFKKLPRKKSILVFEKGNGLFLSNPYLNTPGYREILYKLLVGTNCDGYSYIGKSYVEFNYNKRNRKLNYYRLIYVKDWESTLQMFRKKNYIIYQNEKPDKCCNWFYVMDMKNNWALVSP